MRRPTDGQAHCRPGSTSMTSDGSFSAPSGIQQSGKPLAPPPAAAPAEIPGARHALLLLVLINLFNYVDRQVLAAVEPNIRAEFFPKVDGVEPEHAKELMGFLST